MSVYVYLRLCTERGTERGKECYTTYDTLTTVVYVPAFRTGDYYLWKVGVPIS